MPGAAAVAATDAAAERARVARRRAKEAAEAAAARAAVALPDLGKDEPFVPPSAALRTCAPVGGRAALLACCAFRAFNRVQKLRVQGHAA